MDWPKGIDTLERTVIATPYDSTEMKIQMTQDRLTPFNCVAILIDFQARLLSTIDSIDVKTLTENVIGLARRVSLFDIPAILTTIGVKTFGGPLLPELRMIFSNRGPIECATMSVWEDRRVCRKVEKTGRQKLVVAGLWTDFCVALSAIQALKSGYEVHLVTDACGDLNTRSQDTAIRRMIQAGAISMECRQVLVELQLHEPLAVPDNSYSSQRKKKKVSLELSLRQ